MIWKIKCDIDWLNQRAKNTMSDYLQIEFTELGPDYIFARMPVNERTKQPLGIMHGGASVVLAESVGSSGANLCVDANEYYCVGLDINTNHIRAARTGFVFACAKPLHLGRRTQVWSIEIKNEADQLVSISRLTMAVLRK